jgi:hypothetical protein
LVASNQLDSPKKLQETSLSFNHQTKSITLVFHHISKSLSGIEEARLRWTGKSSRTSSRTSPRSRDLNNFSKNIQLFTINDAIRSVRDVSASTKIKCIMINMSKGRGSRLRHKFATTRQNISGGFEDQVSSQFLVNPELRHSSY